MEGWFKDVFYRAFEWGVTHPSVVETTKVSQFGCSQSTSR